MSLLYLAQDSSICIPWSPMMSMLTFAIPVFFFILKNISVTLQKISEYTRSLYMGLTSADVKFLKGFKWKADSILNI
jgi:hypothetical protein